MKQWKVVYQDTPFNYTSPRALVIEAYSRESALVIAYDHLTRKGLAVGGFCADFKPEIDLAEAKSLGWPGDFMSGATRFLSITEHVISVTGKVIG